MFSELHLQDLSHCGWFKKSYRRRIFWAVELEKWGSDVWWRGPQMLQDKPQTWTCQNHSTSPAPWEQHAGINIHTQRKTKTSFFPTERTIFDSIIMCQAQKLTYLHDTMISENFTSQIGWDLSLWPKTSDNTFRWFTLFSLTNAHANFWWFKC